jgi:hypothetical protein
MSLAPAKAKICASLARKRAWVALEKSGTVGSAGLRLIENGLAFADLRNDRGLRYFLRRHDRLARRIGVAIVEHQGQPGLGLIDGLGRHDRGEGEGRALVADPCRQQAGETVTCIFLALVAGSISVSERR